jgi:ferredoxin/flavodoxin---NADP+ reductase
LHRIRISGAARIGGAFALSWMRDFDFAAGQLVEAALEEGGSSRLYSLFTGPGEAEAGILFSEVEGGDLTPSLARLGAGDELWIEGPSGSFPAIAGPGVWIANGTGVAPFVSMARSGWSAGKTLVHGARASEDFYFQGELEGLMEERYRRCLSRPGPKSEGGSAIFAGRLTEFLESEPWDPLLAYELCGSAGMVVEVRDLLIKKGIPHSQIVSEVYF